MVLFEGIEMKNGQVMGWARQAGLFPSELETLGLRHTEMLRLAREDMREQCALKMEQQHNWLTNAAAASLIRNLEV
jgi:hypothetical protein